MSIGPHVRLSLAAIVVRRRTLPAQGRCTRKAKMTARLERELRRAAEVTASLRAAQPAPWGASERRGNLGSHRAGGWGAVLKQGRGLRPDPLRRPSVRPPRRAGAPPPPQPRAIASTRAAPGRKGGRRRRGGGYGKILGREQRPVCPPPPPASVLALARRTSRGAALHASGKSGTKFPRR